MIKVSVIVPIYNTEKYIEKCINSILNQTLKDIEVILLNDGSTDNTEKIIKTFKDKRIKYIKKENTGIGNTRNLGIQKSKGEYIMFIDSDDYIASDCIEKFYNKAIKDKCDIIISDYFQDNNGEFQEIKFKNFKSSSLKNNPEILNSINLGPCNKIYKTSLLKENDIKFDEDLKYEDVSFVCNSLINANKIGKINEALSYYVIHENSETTTRDKKMFDIIEVCKRLSETFKNYDYLNKVSVELFVKILTDYTTQQRYIKDKKNRNKFIDEAFDFLNRFDKKWRKCEYLKKLNFLKRKVKTNKILTKIYCTLYNLLHM